MTLISPELKRVHIKDRKAFIKESGLSYDSVCALAGGFRPSIKGWLSTHRKTKKRVRDLISRYTLINVQTGETNFIWHTTKQFAEKNEISYKCLMKLINGEKPRYNDWMRKDTYEVLYRNPLLTFL